MIAFMVNADSTRMLSNSEGNLRRREPQHKRNLSASVTVETANVPTVLDPTMAIKKSHRRGLSLDQQVAGPQRYTPSHGSWDFCPAASMELMHQNTDCVPIQRPSTPTHQMSPS